MNELAKRLSEAKLDINLDEENEFLKLLRFLRARKFHVNKSFELLQNDMNWRYENNRVNIRNESADEVLGCDVNEVCKFFPTWIQGVDKQGRPISYRQFGKFEIWSILKLTTMERLIRFHAWETEQALSQMYKTNNYNIETFTIIIDAAGWSTKLATRDAFTFIKGMATTDSDHYPERLGVLLIINAPSVLSFAWRVIKEFLDDVTKAKINILSSPATWQPKLFSLVDPSQVPVMYGGTAADPVPTLPAKQLGNWRRDPDDYSEDLGRNPEFDAIIQENATNESELTETELAIGEIQINEQSKENNTSI